MVWEGNMCFPTEDNVWSSFWVQLGNSQSIACNMNCTALSRIDTIHENLETLRSKACLSALQKRGKRKKGGTRALPKLCVCSCRGSAKWSESWSQTRIGRSQHQRTMVRQGRESHHQNSVELIQVSCEAKMPSIWRECWGHKMGRQEWDGVLPAHLQTSHCRLLTRNTLQSPIRWEQPGPGEVCPSWIHALNSF